MLDFVQDVSVTDVIFMLTLPVCYLEHFTTNLLVIRL